ncbi:MAG: 4Fe-4S dicluster domain-containing protein [bacterium]|nr:4Fe-4S dicluster domain-containing protein [bacterium]
MKPESRGYRIENCRQCQNIANDTSSLQRQIEQILEGENLLAFLQQRIHGPIRMHHELRIGLADCPNACSQPQIRAIGIIGAAHPRLTTETCTQCEACVHACREDAVQLVDERPAIDFDACMFCGQCAAVCPPETLVIGERGFRVQLGGKLGRHPQLAKELPGLFSEDEVLRIIRDAVAFYKTHSKFGERFADVLGSQFYEILCEASAPLPMYPSRRLSSL